MQRFETPTFIIHIAGWLLFLTFPLLFINNEQSGQSSFLLLASPYYWLFCLTYMLMFYVNAMVLVPRLMFKKRYVIYSAVVLLLFGFVYYAQPYDNLLGHNKSVMAALGTLQDSQPKGLNRTLQPGNDSTVGTNAGMPFGPLPNEDLRMQDPNLKKPNGILDLHQSENVDVIGLFIFMMIMGLSIATSTVKRWQNAESKVVKAEAEKATAELSFLKAQINPHFLFNTLNNIYTQSVINSEHTSESIMKLSNIMRYVTDDVTQDFVMMKDEIDCVRDYIELQRLRLGADAEINFNVQGKPDGKKIAPLIFMTFIENAFKYGVTKKEKTIININLSIEKDKIDFTCENKIYQHTRSPERKGIGIVNTHQRLEHLYPNRFKLDINNGNEMFSVNLYVNC